MKLSTKFIIFIILIHTISVALSFYIFQKNKLLFIASEFFILLSLLVCWSLYKEMIRPLQLLMRGVDAIKDRDFNVKFVKTGKHEMDELISVYNQMIDQLRKEKILQQEQHYFLEKLVQTSPTGILLLDYDGHIATINSSVLRIGPWRADELLGKALREVDHPLFAGIEALTTGESRTLLLNSSRTYKIQKAQFIDRGFPCTFVMIEELTVEILLAEKNAYGKVIRMMAHEVNNSIGAVNSILDTTYQILPEQGPIKDAIRVAIERNEHLSAFMRNFADVIRLPEPLKKTIDLHDLLHKVIRLMEFSAHPASVIIRTAFAPGPFMVHADSSQLEQVLINIIKNAIEAIEGGGEIWIKTSARPALLTICNNGKPLSAAASENLFSPFFTTKNGGQGIGLTLAREILTAHGWNFYLRTQQDGWTCFGIYSHHEVVL